MIPRDQVIAALSAPTGYASQKKRLQIVQSTPGSASASWRTSITLGSEKPRSIMVIQGADMAISFIGKVQMLIGDEPFDVIEQEDGRRFVMVPLEDYESVSETAYLLKSDENAEDLAESIGWLNHSAGGAPFDAPDEVQPDEAEIVKVTVEDETPRGVIPKDARIYSKLLAWAEKTVDSPQGLTSDDLDHFRYLVVGQVLPSLLEPVPETSDSRQDRRAAIVNTLVYEPDILLSKLTSGLVPAEPTTRINKEKATSK